MVGLCVEGHILVVGGDDRMMASTSLAVTVSNATTTRTSASPPQVGDGDVDTKTDEHSLSAHSSPSELNPLFMGENEGPPVESMEVEESFPSMEDVEDKMVSSSSSSSPNSEEEVSKGCFCHDIIAP